MKNTKNLVSTSALLLAALVVIAGCKAMPVHVAAPKPVASYTGEKSQLEKGRAIYVSFLRCAKCHRPKPVYDYDPETWRHDILPRMAVKAKLKPDDYSAVLEYVTSEAAQRQPE
ncbi:MAG: hypothetical protein AB8B55_14000 [Mariniblastus sp.]